jgi:hypothetical protein
MMLSSLFVSLAGANLALDSGARAAEGDCESSVAAQPRQKAAVCRGDAR